LIPAIGENAALQLMILIDDTLKPSVGNNLTELKEFITAQPPSTVIAIGYMANAGVSRASVRSICCGAKAKTCGSSP
jgi:hypothetical protein